MKKRSERGGERMSGAPLATFTNLGQDMSTSTTSIQAFKPHVLLLLLHPSLIIFLFLFILFRLLLHHFKVISCERAYASADKICQIYMYMYVCIYILTICVSVCVCVEMCDQESVLKVVILPARPQHTTSCICVCLFVCVCCQKILSAAAVSVNRFQK